MSNIYYVGLDVHMAHTNACILDDRGKRVKQLKIRGSWDKVVETLRKIEGDLRVCYEASCGYGSLFELLSTVATSVVVAHPGYLRLIFQSKRKNDRVDAEKLAKLLFLDEVPVVYVPRKEVRDWRQLILFRERLVAKRTRTKNALRALLRSLGITAPRSKLWTRAGIAWLKSLEMTSSHPFHRDTLLDELDLFNKQIDSVEEHLQGIAALQPGVDLVRSIPGVGPRTAEAVVAYVDNPRRFKSSKAVGSYFGLVPTQDQSGSTNRLGHITRQGPAAVRRLLTEAAWQGIRRSPTIRAYYERVRQGSRDRNKIALVATAHYLVRVMYAMLRHGELWCESEAA